MNIVRLVLAACFHRSLDLAASVVRLCVTDADKMRQLVPSPSWAQAHGVTRPIT